MASYRANKEIAYRQLKGEYLIFSGLTRETLVIHPFAFRLVQMLESEPLSQQKIVEELAKDDLGLDSLELTNFVNASLEQFIDLGVLEYSGD